MIRLQRYSVEDQSAWNDFLGQCKNSHFLFHRNYMDYHRDRFQDHSLLCFDSSNKLIALLPANERDGVLYSHQGLTFGGFLVSPKMKTVRMLEIFQAVQSYALNQGLTQIVYKSIPYIYHQNPAEEDRYALFRFGAVLTRREVTTSILQSHRLPYQERRSRAIRKAAKQGITVQASKDLEGYWNLLEETLQRKYQSSPVHRLEEIQLLSSRFPESIHLYTAQLGHTLVAGTLIYETPTLAHTQYLATNDLGKETGALDLLLNHLIQEVYPHKRYFDFGTSNENAGWSLNEGLIDQKEGFGACAVCHDTYVWKIPNESVNSATEVQAQVPSIPEE